MGASSRYYPKLTPPPPHPGPPTAREPPHRVSGADILTVIENSGQRSWLSRVAGTIEGHATAAWPCTGCSLKSAKDWDKPRLRRGLSRRSGQTRDGCLWCSRPFWAPCLVPRYTPVLSAVTDNLSPRSRSCFGVARWHLAACQHLAVVFPASKLANHKARLSEVGGGRVCGGAPSPLLTPTIRRRKDSPSRAGNKHRREAGNAADARWDPTGWGKTGSTGQGRLVPLQLGDTPRPPRNSPGRMRMERPATDAASAARAGGAEGLPGAHSPVRGTRSRSLRTHRSPGPASPAAGRTEPLRSSCRRPAWGLRVGRRDKDRDRCVPPPPPPPAPRASPVVRSFPVPPGRFLRPGAPVNERQRNHGGGGVHPLRSPRSRWG